MPEGKRNKDGGRNLPNLTTTMHGEYIHTLPCTGEDCGTAA